MRQQGVAALGELYDLAAPRLVRYALMLTRNQDDAEDALQAAIVRIARNPMTLGASRHPWAYFIKVVRNEALKIIQRRKPVSSSSMPAEAAKEEPFLFESLELAESVRQALQKLPPRQSEVVVLKIWEDMTFLEIGEVLGESPNTAASRYRYALDKLTQHLQPLCNEALYG
ncbi:MAG: sigma-70 family RNA polymerase sigma factor [Planctomycetes bacterium]|nr:sigma-70 family RNA polymerase sigma factor [Planctomycetota bacterium]